MTDGTGLLSTTVKADLGNEHCRAHFGLALAHAAGGEPVGRWVAGLPAAEELTQLSEDGGTVHSFNKHGENPYCVPGTIAGAHNCQFPLQPEDVASIIGPSPSVYRWEN